MWIDALARVLTRRAALGGGIVFALLAGCASQDLAPIEQKSAQAAAPLRRAPEKTHPVPDTDQPPAVYTVVAGDTLYAIAWRFGLDARDIGRWNRLDDFNRIFVGQKLKLRESQPVAAARSLERAPVPAAPAASAVQPPLSGVRPLPPVSVPPAVSGAKPASAAPQSPTGAATGEPSTTAMTPTLPAASPGASAGTAATVAEAAPQAPAATRPETGSGGGRVAGGVAWRWPASGKTRPTVAATGAQGIDILGSRGQAVAAAADGQVVYSGSGLRGYGQLIIIKHNDAFLSAYAHNDKLLVSEGSKVKAGQQIAQMGDSEADEVMLHFEIRKGGKAVEPLQFLPAR